ncbi:MAG: sensor histidine kinase N-terminal domain-containing protein [Burkholderiaceae bacterium]|nr:sensor histidine kinase N-terminal domain-containing protein [Burkholderiaceae bacterium]
MIFYDDRPAQESPSVDDLASEQSTIPFQFATQPEEHIQRSLFGEILDWMMVPLLLLWPISIGVTYLVAKSIANQPFDRALEDRVTVLAQQVKEQKGKPVLAMPPAARDIFRADDVDNVYFQLTGPVGEQIDGDREIPLPADEEKPPVWIVQFRYDSIRNTEVRIAYMYVDVHRSARERAGAATSDLALVQVAETLDKRMELANQIVKGVIFPEFIILPVALALVWFALSRGLLPLAELQQRIRRRPPGDLSPIDSGQVPEEISPLVRSLNDMLERLSSNIDMQKRFIADAAHQMKTPLAGMRMQSELALRQTSQEEIHRSLLQLAKSSDSATRLVNQLLALARAENQTPDTNPLIPLELAQLAREVVQAWVQTSFTSQIDLGFEGSDDRLVVMGNPTMLREMLNNLLDNALRYTPPKGSVTVRVRADVEGRLAILEIEDTGPGIPAAERSHVFERFYRILGSNAEGSGLGLAIVREIVERHRAEIDIFNNPRSHDLKFPGSLFRISLPIELYAANMENLV